MSLDSLNILKRYTSGGVNVVPNTDPQKEFGRLAHMLHVLLSFAWVVLGGVVGCFCFGCVCFGFCVWCFLFCLCCVVLCWFGINLSK